MQNYKVLHEAKDHFVIHDESDGKQFKVAKKAMSEKHYQMVKKMPVQNADEGGVVAPTMYGFGAPSVSSDGPGFVDSLAKFMPDSSGQAPSPQPQPVDTPNLVGSDGTLQIPGPAGAAQPDRTMATDTTQPAAQMPITQPLTMTPGLGLQQQGVKEDVQAKTDLGNKVSDIQGQLMANQKEADANFNSTRQALNTQTEQIYNDVLNKKIDPNHYWNSKSVPNQIGSAIAIVLGGLGGGISGKGGNAAMDVINKGIENDINAQRANLDNKRSLLSVNMQRLGNLDQAYALTRSQMYAMAGAQVSQAQAQAMGPEAKAQGDQLLGQLKNAAAASNLQVAQMALFRQKLASGQKPDAIDAVNAGIIPKEYQQKALEEQQSIQARDQALKSANSLFDQINQEQTLGNLANPQSYARVKALKSELVNAVMNVSPAKRLTRETIEQEIDPILTKTRDDKTTADVQRKSLQNMILRHADPTPLMTHYGLAPKALTPQKVN